MFQTFINIFIINILNLGTPKRVHPGVYVEAFEEGFSLKWVTYPPASNSTMP